MNDNIERIQRIEHMIGSSWWDVIQMIYLMGKFQNSCVFLPITIEPINEQTYERFSNRPFGNFVSLSWECSEKGCRFSSPKIFPDDKDFAQYASFLQNCVDGSERFSVIPLELFYKDGSGHFSGHSNVLIYDKILHSLERFDSHGGESDEMFVPTLLDKSIQKFFPAFLNDNFEYFPPQAFCPKNGPQVFEQISRETLGVPIKTGFCSVWSFIYANYRLQFPDKSREDVNVFLIERLTEEHGNLWEFLLKVVIMLSNLSEKIRTAQSVAEIEEAIMESTKELGQEF